MKLSVIIVSYNVKYFLEQCLCSLEKAAEGIEGLGFAIPIDLVSSSISEILDKGYISGRPTIGVEVEYGSLNVWTPKGVYIVSTTNSSLKSTIK